MAVRLPPLVGFLAAGFVINALDVGVVPELDVLADLGVTLLASFWLALCLRYDNAPSITVFTDESDLNRSGPTKLSY
jgi:predicted Kef-type K+ transport protein